MRGILRLTHTDGPAIRKHLRYPVPKDLAALHNLYGRVSHRSSSRRILSGSMNHRKSGTAASVALSDAGELYRQIFERSIDGIAIIDRNGYYVEQNAAHEELTGFSDSELAGQTPAIHLGPEGFTEIAVALTREGRYRGILESRGKTGIVKKIDLSAFTVHDGAGVPVYFVGIKRDITEHEQLAAERDARLRELECLFALTRALNQVHEIEQIYKAAIDALIVAVGADRASILVYDDDNLMHFKAWRGLSDDYRQAVDGHSPWQRHERNAASITVADVFADASLQNYAPVFVKEGIRSLAFIPIAFEGQLLGKFMVYYNAPHTYEPEQVRLAEALATQVAAVIQRRQSEEALRRSEKMAAAGRLAATVAHEINNPLEGIMNLAFLLRQEVLDRPLAAEYLGSLDNELKRLALITRRTLAFYRDTEPPGQFSLRELIEEIVQLFRPKLATASIEVRSFIDGNPEIYGSAGEIRQVLLNLLANAMEAIGTGGSIEVNVAEERDDVVIRVCDSGPGIEEAVAKRIFEPFFTTKSKTGTGLGLALSRDIIERHRGRIEVTNARTRGAVFSVYLPRVNSVSTRKRA